MRSARLGISFQASLDHTVVVETDNAPLSLVASKLLKMQILGIEIADSLLARLDLETRLGGIMNADNISASPEPDVEVQQLKVSSLRSEL
jgi:hypothetical protein